MESNDAVESNRPGIKSAALSPTALSNLLASLSLLACALLPHSVDVGDPINRPILIMEWVAAISSGENLMYHSIVLWPYELALATIIAVLVLVVRRPPWLAMALLLLPIAFASMLAVRWTVLLFSGTDNSRLAMVIAALVAPWGAIVGARMLWLYRSGEVTAAATWGQSMLCVLAMFSLRWFWLAPDRELHVGGILSIMSAMLMMLASWTWIRRARYDLFDRSCEPMHFQVSLRQIIVAVALAAIALTYWQALNTSPPVWIVAPILGNIMVPVLGSFIYV